MKRILLTLSTLLFASAICAGPADFAPESMTAAKVVPLGQFGPHLIISGCAATLDNNRVFCDRSLDSYPAGPRVLQEVQVHPDLFAVPPDGHARQCWARVLFSEDGLDFVEIAKFS